MDKDLKQLHSWRAIGYNFKSLLVWYNSGNSNSKITQEVYKKEILEPYVVKWIKQGY